MTLRARVLLGLAVIAVVLVGGGLFVAQANEAHLIDQVDAQLASAAHPAEQLLFAPNPGESGPGQRPTVAPPSDDDASTTAEPPSPLYTGVLTADGSLQTLFAPNFGIDASSEDLPAVDPAVAVASARTGEPFTVASADGATDYRVLATADQRTGAVVVVALPLTDVDAAVLRLVLVQGVALVVALGVLGLVAWWVLRLGVEPVNEMAHAAAAIAEGDLSHRVPEAPPGTEAGELGRALNQMLGRIEASFEEQVATEDRLRRFAADASHELRTPVTTIRGYAELYRVGALAEPEALDEAMRRTEAEAVRMATLIDELLQLARLDQGRPMAHDAVDLVALAHDTVADARATQPERPITVTLDASLHHDASPAVSDGERQAPCAGALVVGDADRLHQVLANLVGNALVHTPRDVAVDLRVARADDDVIVEVTDHGAGMPPEAATRAFERFYRADPSRARHQGGSGLGLAIAHDVVVAHGGQIELDSRVGVGTTVRVFLPVSGASGAGSAGTPGLLAAGSQAG